MVDASERISASILAMSDRYPMLTPTVADNDGGTVAVWEGWLQPIRSVKDYDLIVTDLYYNRPIGISEDGEILHNSRCSQVHDKPSLRKYINRPDRSFKLRIEYDGGSRHPRAFFLDPELIRVPGDHTFGDGGICAYPPWIDVWNFERNTVADFVDHVLVWLVKWNVFKATEIWLGPERNHDRVFLVATVSPGDQCWCGSGTRYEECHRPMDKLKAKSELRSMFEKRRTF